MAGAKPAEGAARTCVRGATAQRSSGGGRCGGGWFAAMFTLAFLAVGCASLPTFLQSPVWLAENEARAANDRFRGLYAAGRYHEARWHGERAFLSIERALGTDHPATATALQNIALVHCALGRADRALGPMERALEIRESEFEREALGRRVVGQDAGGPDVLALSDTLVALAAVYVELGRYPEAIRVATRRVEGDRDSSNLRVAARLNVLASAHRGLGHHRTASDLSNSALTRVENSLEGGLP